VAAASPVSQLGRAYIYAIHGYLSEMLFTTIVLDHTWTFHGVTSLWPLLVYGSCGLALERIFLFVRESCCLLTRCTFYTLCIYLWQFCTGFLLHCFDACPWDYSDFRFNVKGIITLEYFLFWFVGSLLLERLVISNALRLRLGEPWRPEKRDFPRFELKDD
uniref:Transmembrane protein 229B n=1 Tax=Salvator merianae TaxID=96440 RepID=A0A8D0DSQ6_SALMN